MSECKCANCYFHVRDHRNAKKCRNVNSKYYLMGMPLSGSCDSFEEFAISRSEDGMFYAGREIETGDSITVISNNSSAVKTAIQNIEGIRQNVGEGCVENLCSQLQSLKKFQKFIYKEIPGVYMKLKNEFNRREQHD